MKKWVVIAFLVAAPSFADVISVVGLDSEGKEVTMNVSIPEYQKNLTDNLGLLETSTLNVLNHRKEQSSLWQYHEIVLGLATNFEIGISKIYKVTIIPKLRAVFNNNNNPIIP